MIEIPFDPEIHLGPLTLAWHGIFTAVGIFFGVWLPIRLLRGRVSEDAAYNIATWGVVGGIVGARLLHVADCWLPSPTCGAGYAADPLRIVAIWSGGIAVWGAAMGGVLGGFIAAVRRGDVPIGATADAAAAGIALGFGIGRIGDIINGEHHAVACADLGICVGYTNPATLGQLGPVHLVVAYDMVWDLLGVGLALLLLRTRLAQPPQGRVFWIWLAWYAVGRFMLGSLRVGDPTPFLGLRQDQVIGVGAFVLALVTLALIGSGVLGRAWTTVRGARAA